MIHKHILITEDQDKFLRNLTPNVTESIRRALDEYIQKLRKESLKVSESPS